MKAGLFRVLIAYVAAGLGACSAQSPASQWRSPWQSPLEVAREQLVADLHQCTENYGYNPIATSVAEDELAPRELEWRQCGYDAIRKYVRSRPQLMEQYEQLINEDIAITNAIQNGKMTRAQRRQRLETLIKQIRAAEWIEMEVAATEKTR
jgi:hypothetical protein